MALDGLRMVSVARSILKSARAERQAGSEEPVQAFSMQYALYTSSTYWARADAGANVHRFWRYHYATCFLKLVLSRVS